MASSFSLERKLFTYSESQPRVMRANGYRNQPWRGARVARLHRITVVLSRRPMSRLHDVAVELRLIRVGLTCLVSGKASVAGRLEIRSASVDASDTVALPDPSGPQISHRRHDGPTPSVLSSIRVIHLSCHSRSESCRGSLHFTPSY